MTRVWMTVPAVFALACAPLEQPAVPAPVQERVADGITYRVQLRVAQTFPVTLHLDATLANETDRRQEVTFPDGCVVLMRAYWDEAMTALAWDQTRAVVCTMALVHVPLDPGETALHRTRATAREILGDSLPAGTYVVTALLRPEGEAFEIPAGVVELSR